MKVEDFVSILGADFYTGVPDSQLKALCNYLMKQYGIDERHHIIAANEGNCTAVAAGYYLATGKVPVVYMQNSGEGNVINPLASLLQEKVYAIPMIFVIGWRGEPGTKDEPQHVFQGEVTMKLLEDMGIKASIVSQGTSTEELAAVMQEYKELLEEGKQAAFVVRRGALEFDGRVEYKNQYSMLREEVIRHIADAAGKDLIVSTTGKASRELFEIREASGQAHGQDFLTVGSMGHSSSIAFGIAVNRPEKRVWCIDGDGAVLMHMGALALIGSNKPHNMIHIVMNNEAHETVGGMPTTAGQIDLTAVAKACGYPYAVTVRDYESLDVELKKASGMQMLTFIEVKCAIGSRPDLGRPTLTSKENKENFMKYIQHI